MKIDCIWWICKLYFVFCLQKGWNNQLCIFNFNTMEWSLAESKVPWLGFSELHTYMMIRNTVTLFKTALHVYWKLQLILVLILNSFFFYFKGTKALCKGSPFSCEVWREGLYIWWPTPEHPTEWFTLSGSGYTDLERLVRSLLLNEIFNCCSFISVLYKWILWYHSCLSL